MNIQKLYKFIKKQDGECTCSPDSWFGVDISDCCREHDRLYKKGGEQIDKLYADTLLRDCIAGKRWWLKPVAWIYYAAVRTFGKGTFT